MLPSFRRGPFRGLTSGGVALPVAAIALALAAMPTGCGDKVTYITGGTGGDVGPGGAGGNASSSSSTVSSSGSGGTPATSTTSAGGTGGGLLSGEDLCNGQPISLEPPTDLQFHGDTSMATDDYAVPGCGIAPSGPDLVYELDVPVTGSLRVRVTREQGTDWNPMMYLREGPNGVGDEPSCADDTNFKGCWAFLPDRETARVHVAAGTYYLFIDGEGGTGGPFDLSITFDTPTCGDAVQNPGEECDDGNVEEGDGCDPDCAIETVTLFDECNGEPVELELDQPVVLIGNTSQFADNYIAVKQPPGEQCEYIASEYQPPNAGKDTVYELIPSASGTVVATVGLDQNMNDVCALDPDALGCWDRVIYARGPNDCTTAADANQIACGDLDLFTPETVVFDVIAGQRYYLFVDGFDPLSSGPYVLHVNLEP